MEPISLAPLLGEQRTAALAVCESPSPCGWSWRAAPEGLLAQGISSCHCSAIAFIDNHCTTCLDSSLAGDCGYSRIFMAWRKPATSPSRLRRATSPSRGGFRFIHGNIFPWQGRLWGRSWRYFPPGRRGLGVVHGGLSWGPDDRLGCSVFCFV